MTLKKFRKHEALVLNINNILVLEAKIGINHLIVFVLLPEILLKQFFIGLNFLAKLISDCRSSPSLFVNEILRAIFIVSQSPYSFEYNIEVVYLNSVFRVSLVYQKEVSMKFNVVSSVVVRHALLLLSLKGHWLFDDSGGSA